MTTTTQKLERINVCGQPFVAVFITPERLATLKIGETYSLNRFDDPITNIVEFVGRRDDGLYLWRKTENHRLYIYTENQCCRMIYYVRPERPGDAALLD